MRALTRFRLFPLVLLLSLLAFPLVACAVPDVNAQTVETAPRLEPVTVEQAPSVIDVASRESLHTIAAALEAESTRPTDAALLDAMQADLKSLAWRAVDGKYRATARTGTVGTWETNVRDAVWRALFASTQAERPIRLDFAFPHEPLTAQPPLPVARRFAAVAVP